MTTTRTQGDALDRLQYEDRALRQLLKAFSKRELDPRLHGKVVAMLVEHLAIREGAREYVAESLAAIPELDDLGRQWQDGTVERRRRLARLEEMTRGLEAVNINQGQDVDAAIAEMTPTLLEEIDEEERQLVPSVVERLGPTRRAEVLPSTSYVLHHAPSHPGAHRLRWYERLGPLVRLHALYDYLRGLPAGAAKPSAQVAVPGQGEVPDPPAPPRR